MKVKFLRNYDIYKIGEERELEIDEKSKKYLLTSGTIKILEDDVIEEKDDDEKIPIIDDSEKTEKVGRNGKKGSKK